jgi:hypothetical protein
VSQNEIHALRIMTLQIFTRILDADERGNSVHALQKGYSCLSFGIIDELYNNSNTNRLALVVMASKRSKKTPSRFNEGDDDSDSTPPVPKKLKSIQQTEKEKASATAPPSSSGPTLSSKLSTVIKQDKNIQKLLIHVVLVPVKQSIVNDVTMQDMLRELVRQEIEKEKVSTFTVGAHALTYMNKIKCGHFGDSSGAS